MPLLIARGGFSWPAFPCRPGCIKKSCQGMDSKPASSHSFRPEELPILAIALADAFRVITAEQNRQ